MMFEPYILRGRQLAGRRFDFWITDPVAAVWYGRECQDEPDKLWCLERVKPGMTVIDCGAHHGQMTVAFARSGARVCAFEALARNAMVVERNLHLNGCRSSQVYPYALSDTEGVLRFDVNGGNAMPGSDVAVYAVRLDDTAAARVGSVDFVKIDVEGMEPAVIRGGLGIIRAHRPILDIELHCALLKDREASLREILSMLDGCGYRYSSTIAADGLQQLTSHLLARDNAHLFCEP